MIRIVIALALVVCAFANVVPDLTETEEFKQWSGRIVGGQAATPGQFPYQTSMRSAANAHFCGGFIINQFTVGCAAHCTINRTPGNTVTVVGTNHRITGGTTHPSSRILNHPNYNPSTLANDVSLVFTTTAIVYSNLVQPIPLDSRVHTSGPAIASGWGQTSHPGTAAVELQWVNKEIITNEECRSRLTAGQAARIDDTKICVSSPSGQGLCMGDSGGALLHDGHAIGIVSWGIPCGTHNPDMFARISTVHAWMTANIQN